MTVVVTHTTPADSSFSSTGAAAWNANHALSGVGTMAEQNANSVAITGGTIDGTTVGATTASTGAFTTLSASSTVSGTGFSTYLASPPAIGGTAAAAGTFTTLIGGNDVANYGQLTGGATTKAVEFKSLGSDTNVAYAIRSKGTGAIDLAAGSSGVNISNGGTVTAITLTANGTNYTTPPAVAITAPTTAGGVQATATCVLLTTAAVTVNAGGTGYTVNDVLTLSGGTFTVAATYTVTAVSGGVVTAVSAGSRGSYTATPTTPAATTGGTGTGCTLTPIWGVSNTFTITNAGSGYVEQPTVTFSGGGGSGAAAYATVGSIPTVKTVGSALSFATPNGEMFRLIDAAVTTINYLSVEAGGGGSIVRTNGAGTNLPLSFSTKGTGGYVFGTNSAVSTQQFGITHTASAVNYVQVTGSATGAAASSLGGLSFTGSDASPNFAIGTKGTGYIAFYGQGATNVQAFRVSNTNASSSGNLIQVQGAAAGSAPSISAISGTSGTDTDIDLTLTPKGTGTVRTSGTGLRLNGATSGYVGLKGAAVAGSTTYTLPAADGTNGQVLATNGSATLSWATASGGGALAKQTDVFALNNAGGTYTAPANTQWVKVTVVGGGGSGGGTTSQRGTGGGGGGVCYKWLAMTAGQTLAYFCGGIGATSTVSSGTLTITTISAGGGGAGTSTAYASSNTTGPSGGAASGGDINIAGGTGGPSWGSSTAAATQVGGKGGDATGWGSGGAPAGGGTANGVAGTGYGAGGGGGIGVSNSNATTGIVIFEAY